MKAHFIRMVDYGRFASNCLNDLLQSRPNHQSVKLMAHLLAAEQIWLLRCKGVSTAGVSVWPDYKAVDFGGIIQSNHTGWIAYLQQVTEDELNQTISYQNSAGDEFNTLASDMITQVINHGTHTRAQLGQQLKQGIDDKLPLTDYIYYIRQLTNAG